MPGWLGRGFDGLVPQWNCGSLCFALVRRERRVGLLVRRRRRGVDCADAAAERLHREPPRGGGCSKRCLRRCWRTGLVRRSGQYAFTDAGLHARKIAQDAVRCPGSSLDTTTPLALRPHRRQYVNRTGRCTVQFRCSRQGGQGRRSTCPGSRMRPAPVVGTGSPGHGGPHPPKRENCSRNGKPEGTLTPDYS